MARVLLALLALVLGQAAALRTGSRYGGGYLPPHARGGRLAYERPELLPPTDVDFPPFKSEKMFLDVPLDHFDPDNAKTFKCKYYVNRGAFDADGDGPIFVEMGGEGGCSGAGLSEDARNHSALVVAVEHRFYGESVPFGDMSNENLQFLTVEQNLADTAAIVEHVKQTIGGGKRRVVLNFGGSYSGATAAWFREAYPNVTHGAFSSSGVVNAILDMTQFDEAVAEAIAIPRPACRTALIASTRAMEGAFARGEGDAVKRLFKADNLIGTVHGDTDFWYMAADGAAMADQYGSKQQLCDHLAEVPSGASQQSIIENIANFTLEHYGPSFGSGCFYDSECIKNSTWDHARGLEARSWRWQKCREVAFLQAAPKTGSLRSKHLTIEALVEQCRYAFNGWDIMSCSRPDRRNLSKHSETATQSCPDAFNAKFGGATLTPKEPPYAQPTRIFFTDYSDDPWARASVQSAPSPDLPYCMTTCNGCGHCGAGVPANVTKCRDKQSEYVNKWLQVARAEMESI